MNFYGMSDKGILRELGRRVRQKRLAINFTQESLAEMAGVSRITIGNLEKGQAATLLTFVQVLRSLDSLDGLGSFLPDLGPSPLQVARMKGKKRLKASGGSRKPEKNRGENAW